MFRHLADREGVADQYEADSAGTTGWHLDETPDPRMRQVAAARGLSYTGRARRFNKEDFDRFDLIVAMDPGNREDLLDLAPNTEARAKIRLLREYDPDGGAGKAVPDPYYGGIDGFEEVYQIIERSCRGLLMALLNGSGKEA
jgi:protein-tyrosine phosphatase